LATPAHGTDNAKTNQGASKQGRQTGTANMGERSEHRPFVETLARGFTVPDAFS
jgi:hypothetical protein